MSCCVLLLANRPRKGLLHLILQWHSGVVFFVIFFWNRLLFHFISLSSLCYSEVLLLLLLLSSLLSSWCCQFDTNFHFIVANNNWDALHFCSSQPLQSGQTLPFLQPRTQRFVRKDQFFQLKIFNIIIILIIRQ